MSLEAGGGGGGGGGERGWGRDTRRPEVAVSGQLSLDGAGVGVGRQRLRLLHGSPRLLVVVVVGGEVQEGGALTARAGRGPPALPGGREAGVQQLHDLTSRGVPPLAGLTTTTTTTTTGQPVRRAVGEHLVAPLHGVQPAGSGRGRGGGVGGGGGGGGAQDQGVPGASQRVDVQVVAPPVGRCVGGVGGRAVRVGVAGRVGVGAGRRAALARQLLQLDTAPVPSVAAAGPLLAARPRAGPPAPPAARPRPALQHQGCVYVLEQP